MLYGSCSLTRAFLFWKCKIPKVRSVATALVVLLPAMIIGLAAAFKLIVLNIVTSTRKCNMAATKENNVAPAQQGLHQEAASYSH